MLEKALKTSVLLFFAITLVFMLWALAKSLQHKQKGTYPLPTFQLRLLTGEKLTEKSYLGHPLLINFWASWCVPCLEEMPLLEETYRRYQSRGFVILGIAIQDQREKVKSFVKKHGITFPIAFDSQGTLPGKFGIQGIPESFFVDKRGKVVAHIPAPLNAQEMDFYLEKIF